MKAKKDGKLSTSPDPYGVEDMSVTKVPNVPEFINTRPPMSAFPEYSEPNYHHQAYEGAMANMVNLSGAVHPNIVPPYGEIIPKM